MNNRIDCIGIGGFDQMVVKPLLFGATAIFIVSPSGHGLLDNENNDRLSDHQLNPSQIIATLLDPDILEVPANPAIDGRAARLKELDIMIAIGIDFDINMNPTLFSQPNEAFILGIEVEIVLFAITNEHS